MNTPIKPKRTPSPSRLFMMAQLPFNKTETTALNKPMIPLMNDPQNLNITLLNLKDLGILKEILQKDCTFLEIGTGSAYLLEVLLDQGQGRYMGIEPIPSEAKKAEKRLKPYLKQTNNQGQRSWIHHGKLEDISFKRKIKAQSLNVMYSYHVFEHLENPLTMLSLGQKWLKPGGKMIITCPNVEGYIPRKNLKTWRCNLPSHRWLPGRKTLVAAVKQQGYKIQKCFTYGAYPAPRSAFQSAFNRCLKAMNLGDVICLMATKP